MTDLFKAAPHVRLHRGKTFVIKAGPKHEVLGTNIIDEPVRTSIAIAGGRLFLRGEKHLYCIGS